MHDPHEPSGAFRNTFSLMLALGLGVLGSLPHLIVSHQASSPIPLWATPACLFLGALVMGAYKPEHPRRWAVTVGAALPLIVIGRIVIDSASDATSHNLFPFEIVFAVVFSFPMTVCGAYVGMCASSRW